MMKQITLFRSKKTTIIDQQQEQEQEQGQQQQPQPLQFSNKMTIKGKKNSKVKIVTNKKRHNYWGNIFRRKRIMSEYFSDSAFGSQSDTKIEFFNPWEDPELLKKFRSKRILEYEYDENECMPTNYLAFMNDPNSLNNKKENDKNES